MTTTEEGLSGKANLAQTTVRQIHLAQTPGHGHGRGHELTMDTTEINENMSNGRCIFLCVY